MQPKTKRALYKILPFAILPFIFSVLYVLIEKGILGNSAYYPSTGNIYSFKWNLIITSISSSLFGLSIGIAEVYYFTKQFKQKSFFYKLFVKTLIYVVSMITFLLATSIVNNMVEHQVGITDPLIKSNIQNFFFNWAFWSIEVYITCLIIITLLYAEFTNYIGYEVVRNFFSGKYHQPIEEERVFMFLDMKSSTTIAEKLGHVLYFQMLREYYDDLSPPIVETGGLIYQYVGDEIVVSWRISERTTNDHCIQCFNRMKERLKQHAEKYLDKYGLVPTFKAGIHSGKVTTGEIGKIKKDITFTGDVLNTSARIQGLCNEHQTDLLISEDVYNSLSEPFKQGFVELGMFALRGKDQRVRLYRPEVLNK